MWEVEKVEAWKEEGEKGVKGKNREDQIHSTCNCHSPCLSDIQTQVMKI